LKNKIKIAFLNKFNYNLNNEEEEEEEEEEVIEIIPKKKVNYIKKI
jgi:hypothetical protein